MRTDPAFMHSCARHWVTCECSPRRPLVPPEGFHLLGQSREPGKASTSVQCRSTNINESLGVNLDHDDIWLHLLKVPNVFTAVLPSYLVSYAAHCGSLQIYYLNSKVLHYKMVVVWLLVLLSRYNLLAKKANCESLTGRHGIQAVVTQHWFNSFRL